MKFNPSGYGTSKKGSEYWSTHRSKVSELYRSESYFFTKIIPQVGSVLDIGCAAGGSLCFSRELNPTLTYFGIDISVELIHSAQNRFQSENDAKFIHFDGNHIPLSDNEVELVFSFGVFHHLEDWKRMTQQALRVSKKYILFDLRSWSNNSLVHDPKSYQKIALGEEWDGKTIIQYNIQSLNEVFDFLSSLKKQGISSKAYGYYSKPTSLAVTPAEEVLMLAILLEKDTTNPKIEFMLE